MQFEAVLFDLDDTIADRVAAIRRLAGTLYHAEPALHDRLSESEAVKLFEELDNNGQATNKIQLFEQVSAAWGGLSKTPEWYANWLQTAYPESYEPVPATHAFLSDISRLGIHWGIVSNGPAFQRTKVRHLGLDRMTDCIVISGEIGIRKPQPEIFLMALERLGSAAPDQSVFVGDSPESDIVGAAAAGLKTAWVRRGRAWRPELKAPDFQIDHVTELVPLLWS